MFYFGGQRGGTIDHQIHAVVRLHENDRRRLRRTENLSDGFGDHLSRKDQLVPVAVSAGEIIVVGVPHILHADVFEAVSVAIKHIGAVGDDEVGEDKFG